MEELFNGQLSFADIDAEKFLHVRRAHADRRVNAMDRLTDDVINELIQLCLPHYHIKAGETVQQGRPYTRLETMVRVHLLNVKRQLEHAKASVRCSIEWCFLWLKRIYGYAKVRYRGLAKNHSRALTLFALYNCNRLRKWKATLLITPKLWCALRLECHGALPTLENDICPIFRQISSCFSIIRKNRTTNVHGNFRRFSTPGQKSLV